LRQQRSANLNGLAEKETFGGFFLGIPLKYVIERHPPVGRTERKYQCVGD
jgi:hypothetical protein